MTVDAEGASLGRRSRALAHTSPLHELAGNAAHYGLGWTRLDLVGLAMAALDCVIDHMGLEAGAPPEAVAARLTALADAALSALEEQDEDPPSPERVAEVVISSLLNDRERREQFVRHYTDWAPAPRRAQVTFHLLYERELRDGTTVLRASEQAINVFLGALDLDVEDAQTASEAVLKHQILTGRLDKAVATVNEARVRSVQLEEKLTGVIEATGRDVRSLDWAEELPKLITQAIAHLETRIDEERSMLRHVGHQLEELAVDLFADLTEDQQADQDKLLELRRRIDECFNRHTNLHVALQKVRPTFLVEQARQLLSGRTALVHVDPTEALLRPVLAHSASDAEAVLEAFATTLAPVSPSLLNLDLLVAACLAPQRPKPAEAVAEDEVVLEEVTEPVAFSDDDYAKVESLLAGVVERGEPTRLSLLLAQARTLGESVADLMRLIVLGAFDHHHDEAAAATRLHDEIGFIAVRDATPLLDPAYYGDDLAVLPRALVETQEAKDGHAADQLQEAHP